MPALRAGEPLLLPLTVLVAFLLATGRWGSYLGYPEESIFVTDVALAGTALWLLLRHSRRFLAARLRPLLPLLALAGWAIIRFAVGGQLDLVALRDLAPYVYVLVALAACFLASSFPTTLAAVEGALLLHLAWVWVTLQASSWTDDLPLLGGKVRILEIRADFDGATLAVLACLSALRAGSPNSRASIRVSGVVVALASSYGILEMGSRAGLLALVVGFGVIVLTHLGELRRARRARVLAAAGVLVAAAAIVFPQTYVYDRLTADPRTRTDAGSGTLDARQQAWALVIDDAASNPARLVIGSGFGPDFLDRSGAAFSFEGSDEKGVRAPHNFVLNTLGRTGLVGVAILGWAAVSLTRAGLRLRRPPVGPPGGTRFLTFTALLLGALGVASLVGVILESPFGAVPFWWAAGLLLVGARPPDNSQGDVEPVPVSVDTAP